MKISPSPPIKSPGKFLNSTIFKRTDRNNIQIKVYQGMLKYCLTITALKYMQYFFSTSLNQIDLEEALLFL